MDMRMGTRTAAPRGVCADARSRRNQVLVRAHGQKGQSLVEFALVLPILLALLIGVVVFGIALNHYLVLTNATTAGGRLFRSRGADHRPVHDGYRPVFRSSAEPHTGESPVHDYVTPASWRVG